MSAVARFPNRCRRSAWCIVDHGTQQTCESPALEPTGMVSVRLEGAAPVVVLEVGRGDQLQVVARLSLSDAGDVADALAQLRGCAVKDLEVEA